MFQEPFFFSFTDVYVIIRLIIKKMVDKKKKHCFYRKYFTLLNTNKQTFNPILYLSFHASQLETYWKRSLLQALLLYPQ